MKRALRILKDKRGIAIETALLFMLVIFSLCALITSVATIGRKQSQLESRVFTKEVEIDQIGEDFIAYLAAGEASDFDAAGEKYDSTVVVVDKEENISALTLTNKGSTSVVLYIEAEKTGAGVKILRWRYSAP